MKKTAEQLATCVLEKLAGYYQNVVGFDDPTLLDALRKAGPTYQEDPEAVKAYHKTQNDYWRGVENTVNKLRLTDRRAHEAAFDNYIAKQPPPTRFDPSGRPKLVKGTDYGYLGKYVDLPELYPFGEEDPYSGGKTGKGYLSKKLLLKRLADFTGVYGQDQIVKQVTQSPHKFFTTTDTL